MLHQPGHREPGGDRAEATDADKYDAQGGEATAIAFAGPCCRRSATTFARPDRHPCGGRIAAVGEALERATQGSPEACALPCAEAGAANLISRCTEGQ